MSVRVIGGWAALRSHLHKPWKHRPCPLTVWLPAHVGDHPLTACACSTCMAELVARYDDLIRSLARKYVTPKIDHDDLVQEAWIEVERNLGRYDGAREFGAFVNIIATRRCLMVIRASMAERRGGPGQARNEASRADVMHLDHAAVPGGPPFAEMVAATHPSLDPVRVVEAREELRLLSPSLRDAVRRAA